MKNKKPLYTIDAFVMSPRKDNSGKDECYTNDASTKSILMLCYYIIKFLRKNDGVVVSKFDNISNKKGD